MPPERLLEEANLIPGDELSDHVRIALAGALSAGLPHVRDWQKAGVGKDVLAIADLNGQPLFVDYPVKVGQQIAGYVRAAASKILGNPVVSFEVGPRGWDAAGAIAQLGPAVQRANPNARISPAQLVCYSYPRIGVKYEVTPPGGAAKTVIYDVADLKPVSQERAPADRDGVGVRSFYGAIGDPERTTRLQRFKTIDQTRARLAPATRTKLRAARTIGGIADALTFPMLKPVTMLLGYCSHYNYNEARSHHCFSLQGQQRSDYCAVATCEMILCYYRYYFSQDDIAPKLGYTSGHGCPTDQSAGYEALTGGHVDATFDAAPTFAKCVAAIKGRHPFKSGIAGHARACAGYHDWAPFLGNQRLYIYDPLPWNADYKLAGTITWEDWGAVTHTNCIWTNLLLD